MAGGAPSADAADAAVEPPDLARRQQRRQDLAARAAWLYYMAGNTQDQIATKLNVSRQAAQRLVAAAVSEGLIKFRLDHAIAGCVELGEALGARFGLDYVEVVPGDADSDGLAGIAGAAARQFEAYLAAKPPTVLAFSTGRTLRAAVRQVAPMERPQHTVVSLVGTTTADGRASPYDVVMRLADRVGAKCYPLPTPVVAESPEERDLLQSQRPYRTVAALARAAKVAFVGVGTFAGPAPLLVDGFVTQAEFDTLVEAGGIGEIAGRAFDHHGRPIENALSARTTAIPLRLPRERPTVGIAGGHSKAAPIAAALRGRLLSGLITDEAVAAAILAAESGEVRRPGQRRPARSVPA